MTNYMWYKPTRFIEFLWTYIRQFAMAIPENR